MRDPVIEVPIALLGIAIVVLSVVVAITQLKLATGV